MKKLLKLEDMLKKDKVKTSEDVIRFTNENADYLGFEIYYNSSDGDCWYSATIFNDKIKAVIQIDNDVFLENDKNDIMIAAELLLDLSKEAKRYQKVRF